MKDNVFRILAGTVQPEKYNRIIRNSVGKLFLAVLIVFVFLGMLNMFRAPKYEKNLRELAEEIPEFELSSDGFYIDVPFESDTEGAYIYLTDEIDGFELDDMQEYVSDHRGLSTAIVMGNKKATYYGNGQYQQLEYKDLGGFSISRDKIINNYVPLVTLIIMIFYGIGIFFAIGWHYLKTRILSLFIKPMSKVTCKRNFDDKEAFRITLLSTLLVYFVMSIVEYVCGLAGIDFVIPTFFALILYFAYMLVVLLFFNKNVTVQDFVADEGATDTPQPRGDFFSNPQNYIEDSESLNSELEDSVPGDSEVADSESLDSQSEDL